MWSSTVEADTDDLQVSTSTAIWTDPDPALGEFRYPGRVNRRSLTGEDDFVAAAHAAKDVWATEKARLNSAASDLTAKLNA